MACVVVQHVGPSDARKRDAVVDALGRAGLTIADAPSDTGCTILLVRGADAETLRAVAEASINGERRVLALATPGLALDPGSAWRIVRAGAGDAWAWDDAEQPAQAVRERVERWATIDGVVDSPLVRENLIGRSPAWDRLLRRVVEAALFSDAPMLIAGETGTGKELLARLVHSLAKSRQPDLVVVDCTTIVADLAGSELFGHERGAYTGADRARDGAFALADGGTLFLDEIGELPMPLQAQLLRVVQEKVYKRVGGNTWHKTDFRLVCATNRDLRTEAEGGRFRRDLYFRLAGITCASPSLREREGDIPMLAAHFAREALGRACDLSAGVRAFLMTRAYPGNVRELRRLVHAMAHTHVGPGPITVGDVPPEERPTEADDAIWDERGFDDGVRRALRAGVGLKEIGRAAEEAAIRITLEETGSVRETATRLSITERALQLRKAARRDREDRGGPSPHAREEAVDTTGKSDEA